MSNAENVSWAKPKIGGAVYVAPAGTTLPTDTDAVLNEAFACLGYLDEEGLVNADKREVEHKRAWGGDIVLTTDKGKDDTFKWKMLESTNMDVLKVVHNDANVTGTLDSGITVKSNNIERSPKSFVFDMIMKGNIKKRIVVPHAEVTEIGEIQYVDNNPVAYEVTISAAPDSSQNNHYEYIKKAV